MNGLQVAQLRGMMVYEFRMHWRRRALLVVTLALAFMLMFMMAVLANTLKEGSGLDPEATRRALSATIIFTTWAPIGVCLAVILPVMVADTIPLDRQYGVRDTLGSLPLTYTIYIIGKLLGVWAAVLAGVFGVMVLTAIGWWLLVGPYDVIAYVEMWVVGVAWISILNSGLGILLSVGQPNRRWAIIVVAIFLGISLTVFTGSMQGDDFIGIISPLRGAILSYYLFNSRQGLSSASIPASVTTTPEAVFLTIVAGIIELIVVGALAVAWLRYRDSRA